jgi:hypothetical protein
MSQSHSRTSRISGGAIVAASLLLLTTLMASAFVVAQTSDTATDIMARRQRLIAIKERINATVPSRRDGPLRVDNIHDNEVRDIQAIAKVVLPGTIVNISGVVNECPCEDGPKCSDQVWILGHLPTATNTLELSKIDGRWMIGPVQQWWIEGAKLEARRKSFSSEADFRRALLELTERFPACLKATQTAVRAAGQ